MPVHDWTRVDVGVFHAFHHGWISEISRELNRIIPADKYYALPVLIFGDTVPPSSVSKIVDVIEWYANKKKSVAVFRRTDHLTVAVLDIVTPGNKCSRGTIELFGKQYRGVLEPGCNLDVIDLYPPTSRDPEGIHPVIWGEDDAGEYKFDPAHPLTCAAYVGGADAQAFVEPVAVGDVLPNLPLFLLSDVYVNVPLEATYRSAFEALPKFLQDDLNATISV